MPGIAGSLLQMIEGAGTGATLDLDALPRREGAPIERWLLTFPSFGFLLAAAPGQAGEAVAAFDAPRARRRGLRALRRHAGPPARRGRPEGRWSGTSRRRRSPGWGSSGIAIGWCMTPHVEGRARRRASSRAARRSARWAPAPGRPCARRRARPRSARRSARAARRAGARARGGSTASRSPFQSVAAQRIEPHGADDLAVDDGDRVQRVRARRPASSRSVPLNRPCVVDEHAAAHGEVRLELVRRGGERKRDRASDGRPRRGHRCPLRPRA